LVSGNQVIGTLDVGSREPFTEDDLRRLEAIAGQLTTAIQRKQVEEELRALSARQEAILVAIPDILMEVNNDKVYTWANPAGLAFFGEDVIGKEAIFYFEGEQITYSVVKPNFNGSEDLIYVESWQRRKDGEKRLLAWWCRVLKDVNGSIIGALSSARHHRKRTGGSRAPGTAGDHARVG
jgi:PAS domain-containing protein